MVTKLNFLSAFSYVHQTNKVDLLRLVKLFS